MIEVHFLADQLFYFEEKNKHRDALQLYAISGWGDRARGVQQQLPFSSSCSDGLYFYQEFLGVMRSAPMYGRRTSGINTLPSACW